MNTKQKFGLFAGIGVIAFLGYRFFRFGETAKNINANIVKVDFNKSTKNVILFLRIINPSSYSIGINSIIGDVYWNDNIVGTLNYLTPVTIEKLSEKIIQLPISMNLSFGGLIADLFSKGGIKKTINGNLKFTGALNSGSVIVPLSFEKQFNLI